MKEQLFIDKEEVFTRFGVSLSAGALDELLAFPALKEPAKNNWPEEEGIEVDLETPCLQSKEVSLSFFREGPESAGDPFIAFVGRPGYRIFHIPALQKEWRLRLLSQSALKRNGAHGAAFTLKLADDFPYRPVRGVAGGGGLALPVSDFTLDGVSLERYGLVVESGGDECLQSASVKQGLTRQFAGSDGVLYDTGQVVFNSKEVTLRCCLAAASMERFWACYDAFFHALVQPGERLLRFEPEGRTYACYYKQTSGFRLLSSDGPVVAGFSLALVFTALQTKSGVTYLLAAEDGAAVSTEDNCLIDVTPAAFMPTLVAASPVVPGSAASAESTEFRLRKISEMPEVAFTDNLIVPAVHRETGRNVHLPAELLTAGGEGGGGGGSGATTLGGLKNVARTADSAADGSILVKKEGIYQPREGVLGDMESLMAKVFPFTLALEGGGTFEKGSTASITLRWEYDRAITTQTLQGETLPPSLRTKTIEGVKEDSRYTLSAVAGNLAVSRTVEVLFRLKKYWGVSASAALSDEQVRALHTAWAVRGQAATRFDCTGGKYAYYILPASMAGGIQFWIGGLRTTDWQQEVRPLTNASGYTEPYAIFRLNHIQTGVLNIEVK